MTRDTIIDQLDALKDSPSRIDEDDEASKTIALAHCVQALRYTMNADGVSPSRRQTARAAYKLGCAALNREKVLAIRASDEPPKVIAQIYGVTSTHIRHIQLLRLWRHV